MTAVQDEVRLQHRVMEWVRVCSRNGHCQPLCSHEVALLVCKLVLCCSPSISDWYDSFNTRNAASCAFFTSSEAVACLMQEMASEKLSVSVSEGRGSRQGCTK